MKTRIIEILEHLNSLRYKDPIEKRTAKYIANILNSTPGFIHNRMRKLVDTGYVKFIIAYPNANHQDRVHIYYVDTEDGRLFEVWAREQRIY